MWARASRILELARNRGLRKTMMSSRERFKRAMSDQLQCLGKSGRSSGPILRQISTQIVVPHDIETSSQINNQPVLTTEFLESVISSQRRTIDNFQKDRDLDQAKIEKLTTDFQRTASRLKELSDYDDLKSKALLGYDAGFELGMMKVNCFD